MHKHGHHSHTEATTTFGLWVYLMSDCLLFASLFAAYAVLHTQTAGCAGPAALFNTRTALIETLILLTSSFTSGLALLAARRKHVLGTWLALGATVLLGDAFLAQELTEFSHLIHSGNGPDASAFLSSYFALVGTHGLHITLGLLWALTLFAHLALRGLAPSTRRGIAYFALFWHFLDIVWIFIFTIVYLLPLI
jgi:cytochrome o ubiquinol oxidase subunit 3